MSISLHLAVNLRRDDCWNEAFFYDQTPLEGVKGKLVVRRPVKQRWTMKPVSDLP